MKHVLPLLKTPSIPPQTAPLSVHDLLADVQARGMRWLDADGPGLSRIGGAGPSDHKAVRLGGQTLMVPIFTYASRSSPYVAIVNASKRRAELHKDGVFVEELTFVEPPKFYARSTQDGIPYFKIATLHSEDVLATTVLQTCTRYGNRRTSCQFCAIGQSLAAKRTIAEKTPAQLAEVAIAAVELDGVRHMVMTTGTPATSDRGAGVLAAAAQAVTQAVDLPIQGQCEPPDDFAWFSRMRASGVVSLGMHLEAVTDSVRKRIMPGKAEVSLEHYFDAFAAAVEVFGRGQVSTYILAGLGDSARDILETSERLAQMGVYPFVVPFVPIGGTPLEAHPQPDSLFMHQVLDGVANLLNQYGLSSESVRAGCAKCGACSSLKSREAKRQEVHCA